MASALIPLILDVDNRSIDADEDAYIKNAFVEKSKNSAASVKKRPAIIHTEDMNRYSVGGTVFLHKNTVNGEVYLLVQSAGLEYKIYDWDVGANSSNLITTWTITVGGATLTDMRAVGTSAGNDDIFIKNFFEATILDVSAGTVAKVTDVDFPAQTTSGIAYLDGFTFVAERDTDLIRNSDLDDPTSWAALGVISAEMANDNILELSDQQNHVIAFGATTIQVFRNAGNPVGSPLAPREDLSFRLGINKTGSTADRTRQLWRDEESDTIAFVAVDSITDGRFVAIMKNLKIEHISTEFIDAYLNTGNIAYPHISGIRHNGRVFICLTIDGNKIQPDTAGLHHTFVYDTLHSIWYRWESAELNHFRFLGYASANESTASVDTRQQLIIDVDGQVYTVDDTVYQDTDQAAAAKAISVVIQTPKFQGSQEVAGKAKFQGSLQLLGDRGAATNNVGVEWSDDDYQSWNTSRNVDISIAGRRLTGGGSFIERAYRLTHTANLPLRINSIYLSDLTVGD